MRLSLLSQRSEELGVTAARRGLFAGLHRSLDRVVIDRVEERPARTDGAVVDRHQSLFDETSKGLEQLAVRLTIDRQDGFGSRERPTPTEARYAPEDLALMR